MAKQGNKNWIRRVIRSRVFIGSLLIFAIAFLASIIAGNSGIATIGGEILVVWWLFCFLTRNWGKERGNDA